MVTLNLVTDVEENFVKLSCSITNSGTKSIYPYLTNLYISEGNESSANESIHRYLFESITEHQIDRSTGECFDCKLAQHCKSEEVNETTGKISFPECEDDSFEDNIRYCCNLRQLSYFTIVHIMPKETFREEIFLKINKPGVYRAFIIYTGKEWDDCICTSQVFRIKEK